MVASFTLGGDLSLDPGGGCCLGFRFLGGCFGGLLGGRCFGCGLRGDRSFTCGLGAFGWFGSFGGGASLFGLGGGCFGGGRFDFGHSPETFAEGCHFDFFTVNNLKLANK